jgi:hypothetical protein
MTVPRQGSKAGPGVFSDAESLAGDSAETLSNHSLSFSRLGLLQQTFLPPRCAGE